MSHAFLAARCARMNEARSTIRILSDMRLDSEFRRRLGDRIAKYYAFEGDVTQHTRKLGVRLDRCARRW